ncbi:MAG TPA: hypothetical protein VKG26_11415 [Bacteroidia bacterium]|nr:hypothetical protein [Bacteroidia bacterium]
MCQIKHIFSIVFLATLLGSCSENPSHSAGSIFSFINNDKDNSSLLAADVKEPVDLLKWVEDPSNKLRQEKKIGETVYSLQYRPSEYIFIKDHPLDSLPKDNIKKEISFLSQMQYYTLRIKIEDFPDEFLKFNMSNGETYDERVSYFSFEMQKDLQLVDGEDTLPCRMFHFERTFNVEPFGNFLIAFENPNKEKPKEKRFIYEDRNFGTGKVQFTIPEKNLIDLPHLY